MKTSGLTVILLCMLLAYSNINSNATNVAVSKTHNKLVSTIPGLGTAWFAYGEQYDRIENIIRGHEPAHFTYIYSDSFQYYYDNDMECLLPNGYYSSDYFTVYEIQGGYLVQTFTISQCSTCPYPVLPYMPDPFIPCTLSDPEI